MLVNDVWGAEHLFEWDTPVWEHDLDAGLRILRLALDTHLITSHHALPLLIRNPGGLVVEMTDGTAEYNATRYRNSIFYDLAKTAVIRLAFAQAKELAPHGGTAVAITPGWLRSEAMLEAMGVTEANWREGRNPHFAAISETPRYVGRAIAALAADPDVARHNGGSFSSGGLAQEYGFTDLDGSRPDCWRYLVEVQDAGKPAGRDGLPLMELVAVATVESPLTDRAIGAEAGRRGRARGVAGLRRPLRRRARRDRRRRRAAAAHLVRPRAPRRPARAPAQRRHPRRAGRVQHPLA